MCDALDGRHPDARRPDMRAETAVLEAVIAFDNLARSPIMEERSSLTKSQADALLGLAVIGKMNMTQISKHLAVSREQATRAVAPLVERGLVRKERDPNNRRVVEVSLTEAGRLELDRGRDLILQNLSEKLSALSDEDRDRLERASREVVDVLRRRDPR